MRLALAFAGAVFAFAIASSALADDIVRFETKDWILTAPPDLATQADLELIGRLNQRCTDEIVLLTGFRPATPRKFTWTYVLDPNGRWGGGATPGAVIVWIPPGQRAIPTDDSRRHLEFLDGRGVCFGPHEVTHVLTFPSGMPAWAFEGLATFTDQLYQEASWSCCSLPLQVRYFRCEESGYVDGLERKAYSDLSPFAVSFDTYRTASCVWWAAYERGGFPALRGILTGLRRSSAPTTGEFVVHHVNRVLNADLRRVVARYGFEPAELAAGPVPTIAGCTLVGMAQADVIVGTSGPDTVCGLGGSDRLTGGAGADALVGGPGNDVLNARDGRRDLVRGGSGRDTAVVDKGLDQVTGVERVRP